MRATAWLVAVALVWPCLAQPATTPPARPAKPAAAKPGKPAPKPARWSTRELLRARVSEVELRDTPLHEALTWVAKISDTNLVVHWTDLETEGVDRETTVNVSGRNISFDQLVRTVLNDATRGQTRLAYALTGRMILVTTVDRLNRQMITKVYPVADLLFRPQTAPIIQVGRETDVVRSLQANVAEGSVGVTPIIERVSGGVQLNPGDRSNLWDGQNDDDDDEEGGEGDRSQMLNQLVNVITSTVEPESWDVNGGRGTVRAFGDVLIVRNSPLVHQALGGALDESDVR